MKKLLASIAALAILLIVSCAPEVGSLKWCEAMDEKPKGDWSANEATEYTKNCIFRSDDEEE